MTLCIRLLSLLILLASACTRSFELAQTDSQTHWMTHCDEDSDCGRLACICGACTLPCESDDECALEGEGSGMCSVAEGVLDGDACDGDPSEVSACVPRSTGAPERSGGDGDGAGSVAAAPVSLRCGGGTELTGSGSYQIVASETINDFVVAADGTIYAITFGFSAVGQIMRIGASGTSLIAPELDSVQNLMLDGDQLIVANLEGEDPRQLTIAAIDLETEEVVVLAQQDALNPPGFVADADYIYWTADDSAFHSTLWRNPRVPGESMMLGEITGGSFGKSLTIVRGQLFLLGYPSEGAYPQLFRVEKTGSGGVSGPLGTAPPGIWDMVSDGENMFVVVHRTTPDGMASSIIRMSPEMKDHKTLIDLGTEQQAVLSKAADESYIYWMGLETPDTVDLFSVWRSRTDGAGDPEQLATLENFAGPFGLAGGALYWLTNCPNGGVNYIVKMATP